jgi:hypothetical protein
MLPRTLSASSLKVASLCLMRWKAEYLDRTPSFSTHTAAEVGSTFHLACERYVEKCYIERTHEPSWNLLKDLLGIAFIEIFKSQDLSRPEYQDALKLAKRWHDRTSFEGVEVMSVEKKETITIEGVHDGQVVKVPFNYIIDRVDRLGPGEYRVVDYKTQRVPMRSEELHDNVQARAYALAVQIKYPDAVKIRVQMDLIRHDPVGIIVTKQENIEFWNFLCATVQDILDVKEADVKPTLNMECGYCVLKATCPALRKNIGAGGIHKLSTGELAHLQFQIEAQMKANGDLKDQIEELLLLEAVNRDELGWAEESTGVQVEVVASRRRQIDASEVAKIIGPEEFSKLGSITIGVVDDLVKDPNMTPEQRQALKSLIYYKTGEPKAKDKPIKKVV